VLVHQRLHRRLRRPRRLPDVEHLMDDLLHVRLRPSRPAGVDRFPQLVQLVWRDHAGVAVGRLHTRDVARLPEVLLDDENLRDSFPGHTVGSVKLKPVYDASLADSVTIERELC
jgi:hypothetical protein